MALSYVSVDRDQLFLVPPSMRDWLPEGHLVWFVLDVVERVDTSALHARHPNDGVGRRAYDPEVLLALLIYAYCGGIRSSRRIERLCEVDVAFRVICAGHAPDHTTIARFRQGYDEVAQQVFVDVLELCATAGLVEVGLVAVDGTKVTASASRKANRTRAHIEAEVKAMFDEAAEVDAQEDQLFGGARGDELPAELADPRRRGARLAAALEELQRRREAREAEERVVRDAQRERWEEHKRRAVAEGRLPHGRPPEDVELAEAEAVLATQEARAAERARRRAAAEAKAAAEGRKMRGPKPDHDNHRDLRKARQRMERARARASAGASRADPDSDEDRVNTTDPASRLMKGPHSWVQGYNGQAAVNTNGVVLAAYVTQNGNDVGQCVPMMAATLANLDAAGVNAPIDVMVFDAGYLSEDNLTATGPDRLIATAKAWKLRKEEPTQGPAPPSASPIEAMDHRLRTPEGSATYAKRQHTVEPVFGDVKDNRGLRRFSRRGLRAVDAEWKLTMTVHNALKLFRQRHGVATT